MKKDFILSICFLMSSLSYAQEVRPQLIPQAPDAQAIARSIDIPVNLYTGIPAISIPLYEIVCGDIRIPISISYQGGGILANQEASSVGLGWMIHTGGQITRTVKCIDDFDFVRGYCSYTDDYDDNPNFTLYFHNRHYVRDLDPDIFYYSTINESGKFYFNHQQEAHFINKGDINKLQISGNGIYKCMSLKDGFGITYSYQDLEKTRNYYAPYGMNVNTTPGGKDLLIAYYEQRELNFVSEHISSWHLTNIVSPAGDTINYVYTNEKYQLPIQESAQKNSYLYTYESPGVNNETGETTGYKYSTSKVLIDGKRLQEINWRGGRVVFEGEDRTDIMPQNGEDTLQCIKAIKVYDYVGNLVKYWRFNYSYFDTYLIGCPVLCTKLASRFERFDTFCNPVSGHVVF